MPPQAQGQMPAVPNHQETVAVLRHTMRIVDELQILDKNPSLGRSDVRSQIIDGVSKLVGDRLLKAADAIPLLADVPTEPLMQRKWVQQMLKQTVDAQNNVLSHHVAGNPATLDWAQEQQHQAGPVDDHMDTLSGLTGRYR